MYDISWVCWCDLLWYVCICIHIGICTYVYVYVCIHRGIHVCIRVCICIEKGSMMHIFLIFMAFLHMYIYVYLCMYVCVYYVLYVYQYIPLSSGNDMCIQMTSCVVQLTIVSNDQLCCMADNNTSWQLYPNCVMKVPTRMLGVRKQLYSSWTLLVLDNPCTNGSWSENSRVSQGLVMPPSMNQKTVSWLSSESVFSVETRKFAPWPRGVIRTSKVITVWGAEF